jgi:hypothetical protein
VEKILQHEIIVAHVQKHNEGKDTLQKEIPQFRNNSNIDKLRESYLAEFNAVPSDVEVLLNRAKKPEDAYEALCALKKKIFLINVL